MNTQKVEPCEFVAGLCSNCGASEQLGCQGWVAPADRIQSLSDQVEALTKERDALAAAAKLALDALDAFAEWEDMGDPQRPATEAIAALRQAGVQ